MCATLLRLAMLGFGALLVSSCAPILPTSSSAGDDTALPSGNPATAPMSSPSPSGTQPMSWGNTPPAGNPKKTPLPVTDDWSKPTPDMVDNPTPTKVSTPKKTTVSPKVTADTSAPEQAAAEKPAPPNATETADDSDAGSGFDNLELVDASLGHKLNVLRVVSDRTDSNLLSVVAELKNKTAHILEIEVQTIYKDKASTPLSTGTGSWIPMKLKPHESTDYRSVALSPEAVDFLVRIRLPQKPADDQ
jgi:hypothetical protein